MKKPISIFLATALSVGMAGTSIMPSFAANTNKQMSNRGSVSTTNANDADELLKKVEIAQEEYDKAKKAYDEGALQFLESNCPAGAGYVKVEGKDGVYERGKPQKDYYYIDNQLCHLKNSPNEIFKNAYEEEGGNIKKQITFTLLQREATLLDDCNKRRAKDTNFVDKEYQAPLKLAPELVLVSMIDSMIYSLDMSNPHVLIKNYMKDNAIWDVTSQNMEGIDSINTSPFEGWYDEEEYLYRTGDDQYPIPGKPGQTSWVLTTGHYKTIMKKYGLTDNEKVYHPGRAGFGIFLDKKTDFDAYSYSAALGSYNEMNVGGKLYTSDEWRKAVDEYEAPLKENLEKAEKNLKEAKEAAGIANDKDNTGDKKEDSGSDVTPGGDSGNKSDIEKPDAGKDDNNKSDAEKPNGDDKSDVTPKPEAKKATITNIKISATKYVYNGKVKTPVVSVYADGKKLNSTQYTVSYASGRKNIGIYTVKVAGNETKGYTGKRSATFQIIPKTIKTPSVKSGKKKATIKWGKVSGGIKYQIGVQKKGGKAKYYSATKNSLTIKKLASKKKYTAKIRAYKKVGGKTVYGNWSKAKTFKVK